jgi:hypothetical protein
MRMNAVRFLCIAAIVVAVRAFPLRYRRNIPAGIRMRRMMRAQPVVRSRIGGKGPRREQIQAQSQNGDETEYSAFHTMTSQTCKGTARRAQSLSLIFLILPLEKQIVHC